jgi:FxLD family lantipeptide
VDPITSQTTSDNEFDLDVSIVESGSVIAGAASEECTSDNCGGTTGVNC